MKNEQQLTELILSFINQRKEDKAENFFKDKPKRNKQGVIANGAINTRLSDFVSNFITSEKDKDAFENIKKMKKQKGQSALEFQIAKYNKLLQFIPENTFDDDLQKIKDDLQQFTIKNDGEHQPETWLTQWTPKAIDISFATHVAKLTHSSSKGSSILDTKKEINSLYLTTSSLSNREIDTASGNAASLPIAKMLELSCNGLSVLDCVKNDNTIPFEGITNNKNAISTWLTNLEQAYNDQVKSSYFLNKQIYFPIDLIGSKYHLLLPLTSSSLIHSMFLEHQKYFSDDAKKAREQKKNSLYSSLDVRSYPNKAILHVTGSNHSNASSLNGKRGGKITLLPTMPPQWHSQQSISTKDRIFDISLSYHLKNEIKDLEKYLIIIKKHKLSINKPERNVAIALKLQAIAESFLDYIEMIQISQIEQYGDILGWSKQTDLPLEQQLLFEPQRQDEDAKSQTLKQWTKTLSNSYGRWLNNQLKKSKSLTTLTPTHAQLWSKHFLLILRKYIADKEVI